MESKEIREWANSILAADSIAGKLAHPGILTDDQPGSPLIWDEPVRLRECLSVKNPKKISFLRFKSIAMQKNVPFVCIVLQDAFVGS